MNCSLCHNPKKPDKRSDVCKSCSLLNFHKNKHAGKDVIYVEHKAGKRKTQKVVKFRDFCPTCGCDKGYVFKTTVGFNCNKCSIKISYHSKRNIYSNGGFIRLWIETPNQGLVFTRSSYEYYYLNYLNSNNVNYMYEPKPFVLSDNSSYLPDIHLLDTNEYVEIKGRWLIDYKKKFDLFKKDYPHINIKIITHKDLKELGYSSNGYKNSFTHSLCGSKWTIFLQSDKDYDKKHGTDSCAITYIDDKQIYFRLNSINLETIYHEIYHVYYDNLNLESTKLKEIQLEEINAEMVSKNLIPFMYHGFKIFSNLTRIAKIRYHYENKKFINTTKIDQQDLEQLVKFSFKMFKNKNYIKLFDFEK